MAEPSVVLRFLRPATLPAPTAGVLGGAVAASAGWPADSVRLLAAIASAILLTGASNGINQIADVETDRINRPERPIPSGRMGIGEAWAWVAALTVVSFALAAWVNLPYFACVAVTLPLTMAYSLPPLRTKRVPFLANITIAIPRGLLLVVAGWAVGGGWERAEAWILGALAFLYVFGASITKDFGDVEGDRETGCLSLPILWGPNRAARFVAPFLVVPFALYPIFALAGWLPGGVLAWCCLGLPLALLGLRAAWLLVRDPMPPADGSPHRAWGLMYLQLTLAHLGSGVLFWVI